MKKAHLLLTVTTISALTALAEPAQAINNPHGNVKVELTVGRRPNGVMRACFKRSSDGLEASVDFGNAGGMTRAENILLNGGDDIIFVVGGFFQSRFACGENLGVTRNNGFKLQVQGVGGNDSGHCGHDNTDCLLGLGNDSMFAHSPIGRVHGQGGNDNLFGDGTSSGNADRLFGGTGNDCLNDPGNEHAIFDCGDGADRAVNRPVDAISCEESVSSC
jgi:hypothetical protein